MTDQRAKNKSTKLAGKHGGEQKRRRQKRRETRRRRRGGGGGREEENEERRRGEVELVLSLINDIEHDCNQ